MPSVLNIFQISEYQKTLDFINWMSLKNQKVIVIECEFGDSVAEVLVDETVTILAGDIADYNTLQNNSNNVEKNN